MLYINRLIRGIMHLITDLIVKSENKDLMRWAMVHFKDYYARYIYYKLLEMEQPELFKK